MSELVEQADRQYEIGCHKPKWVQCGALCHEKYYGGRCLTRARDRKGVEGATLDVLELLEIQVIQGKVIMSSELMLLR